MSSVLVQFPRLLILFSLLAVSPHGLGGLRAQTAPSAANAVSAPAANPSTPKRDAPTATPAWLDARVRAEVAAFEGNVSLYAKNLDTGATYDLGGDRPVRTASTIKVAIMVEAFARVAEGRARWSDELLLTKEKKVPGAGVLQEMSDGLRLTLRDAVNLMIVVSDNTATNLVLDYLTADAVNARMEALGFRETRVMRKINGGGESREGALEANKRFGIGRSTPREMVALLEKLEAGAVVSPAVSREMIELLKRQQSRAGAGRANWQWPAALKPGALDALRSNVGILYTPRGRIALAITCDDIPVVDWSVDNPGDLLMSRLSVILVDGLGKNQ